MYNWVPSLMSREALEKRLRWNLDSHRRWTAYFNAWLEKVLAACGARGKLDDNLFDLLSDHRNLRRAWDFLVLNGGRTPGLDGLVFEDFEDRDVWEVLRDLSREIRQETYRPGKVKHITVPKASGRGTRQIAVPNIVDRIVFRAVSQVLLQVYDDQFVESSFGFRPERDRTTALAYAEELQASQPARYLIVADIKNCFDCIPRRQLKELLAKRLPEKLVRLCLQCVKTDRPRGLLQGGSLSPLLLNVYLHHHLDRPWQKQHRATPLLRTVDDLLILVPDGIAPQPVLDKLISRLKACGLQLRQTPPPTIADLQHGQTVDWLGFELGGAHQGLSVKVGSAAWKKLDEALGRCRDEVLPELQAARLIEGWLAQVARAGTDDDFESVHQRLTSLCEKHFFFEASYHVRLQKVWERQVDLEELPSGELDVDAA